MAHCNGVYVEGIESAEPWKLATAGQPHTDHDDRPQVFAKRAKLDEELEKVEKQEQQEVSKSADQVKTEDTVKEEKLEEVKPQVKTDEKSGKY